jgi:hypothetical protein
MHHTMALYYHCASLIGLGHLAPAASLAIMMAVLFAVLAAARYAPRLIRR